ncbi:MAG: hypothetical protein JOZ78_00945 [Chroococcidiopsidaceae cyanobacterium CP_BM_ER_R8_30]|nr:hypothetical protein [Chroococcidiopsidaceae cyanobacterium CP_BM_ER_R8_30]
MLDGLPRIIPASQPEIEENLAAYQATSQFYQEVRSRTEFKRYCDWYYAEAATHRRELQQMRGEFNLLGWFRQRR